MAFVTYENRRNRHVTIHVEGCSQIRKHGGEHAYGQGDYHNHATFLDAQQHAQQTGLPLIECSFCKPGDQHVRNVQMFGLGGRGTELADIWVGLLEWVCEKQEELVAALTRVSS